MKRADIVQETINRIRLSDSDLVLLNQILDKLDKEKLSQEKKKFHEILVGRAEGRLKLKENNPEL